MSESKPVFVGPYYQIDADTRRRKWTIEQLRQYAVAETLRYYTTHLLVQASRAEIVPLHRIRIEIVEVRLDLHVRLYLED